MAKTLDTTRHDRRLARRLKEDAEFRTEFERQQREIVQIDAVVRQLDELREEAGMSKAELARAIGKEPSSIRRFFTADVNPELKTVAAVADVLGAKVEVVATGGRRAKRAGASVFAPERPSRMTSIEKIRKRTGTSLMNPKDFDRHFGSLPTDGEG